MMKLKLETFCETMNCDNCLAETRRLFQVHYSTLRSSLCTDCVLQIVKEAGKK